MGEKTYMTNNRLLGNSFAKDFNKKYGIITYSGTLAIEIALNSLNLRKQSKVLVLSEVCYSIVNTIIKLNLTPIIVNSKNQLYLTDSDIDEVLKKENIDCIILVHQYGILNNINFNKYMKMGIKIIEDVAQAWSIGNDNYIIGKYSDIVVTSFGKTKPLSYGIGGGLFFNDSSVFKEIDYCDNESREKEGVLLSYAYPICESIKYDKLKTVADSIVEEQRNNAKEYSNLLKKQEKIKFLDSDIYVGNVWHRFPIWVDDIILYDKIVQLLKSSNLEYQLEHEIKLEDLPICTNCIKINNQCSSFYLILLRTRNINIKKQLKELDYIIKCINK